MTNPPETGGTLADFMAFVWRHRFLIVGMVGIVTLATVIYVLVIPVEYTARATVLPQDTQLPGMLSAAMAYLGGGQSSIELGSAVGDAVIQDAVLRSRRLADAMNEEYDLEGHYGVSRREPRLRRWYSRLTIRTNRQGLLTVAYRDRDPEFAHRIVVGLLEHLDRFNREIRSTAGRRVREFLEERMAEAESRLNALEDSIAAYQASNQTLVLEADDRSTFSLGADLMTRRIQLVTEAQMLRRTLGSGAPALAAKEMEIEALNRELARLPELNSELSKLLRSRRVQTRTHSFLFAQLEESRIEEARNTPTIEILDPPVVPQEKSWPQRTWTVLLVFSISIVGSLALAKGLDSMREVRRRLEAEGV